MNIDSVYEISEKMRKISIEEVGTEIIKTRIKKTPSGKYRARCPLCEGKSPSFYLLTDANRYHCYGCGSEGGTVTLASETLGDDALAYLLKKMGLEDEDNENHKESFQWALEVELR